MARMYTYLLQKKINLHILNAVFIICIEKTWVYMIYRTVTLSITN